MEEALSIHIDYSLIITLLLFVLAVAEHNCFALQVFPAEIDRTGATYVAKHQL